MAEIEFYGATFHVSDTPNEFALMEFAEAGEALESNTLAALATVYRLLQDSIVADPTVDGSTDESEWQRFRVHARKNRATSETLMPVIFAVMEGAAGRPTGQPADSSAGPQPTPLKSESQPEDQASDLFPGRPDMQLALVRSRSA